MAIRVAIGASNYLYGEGLKELLKGEKEIQIVGIFDEERDMGEILRISPDVVIVENSMFQNLSEIPSDPKTKFLLLMNRKTAVLPEKRIAQWIGKGLVGILPPGADAALLKKAIKAICSGELWLDRKTMSRILSQEKPGKGGALELTKSEREVAALICQGYRNKEIALKLNISEQTVKSHCNRIYKKFGISDRLQLAIYFMQGGNESIWSRTTAEG
jgi:DNA-binding NarL/FixJ family response regulator